MPKHCIHQETTLFWTNQTLLSRSLVTNFKNSQHINWPSKCIHTIEEWLQGVTPPAIWGRLDSKMTSSQRRRIFQAQVGANIDWFKLFSDRRAETQTNPIRVFHNNAFLWNDRGGLGISYHNRNIHSDFFSEFSEAIFLAAWGHAIKSMKCRE